MSLAAKEHRARFPDNLPKHWARLLEAEADKPYFQELSTFLRGEFAKAKTIFPPQDLVLSALQTTDYPDVRIVVLGQDPYHGPGQAIGRSFAVPNNLRVKPPSLVNIFKELESDLDLKWNKQSSDLSGWVSQGVLLLNAVLTVERSKAFSHKDKGWEHFTDRIVELLNQRKEPLIFMLWGSAAQKKAHFVDTKKHFILKAVHPSPLSAHRGFFGCQHFSRANKILRDELGQKEIDWSRISDAR